MKKTLIIIAILAALLIIPVSAANVGDKIAEAVHSDITACVNNYPIESYVVNGYAVIVAEDLRDYCCDVVYDNATRSLHITKAGEGAVFTDRVVYKTDKPTGAFYKDVLYTDIKTYVNGNEVKSFNVNGKTMIVIDEFGKYMDGYTWDSINRAAIAYLADKDMAEFKVPTKRTEVLFKKAGYSGKRDFSTWVDMDFDGVADYIKVSLVPGSYDGEDLRITLKEMQKTFEGTEFVGIDAVYVTDMDINDGVRDLVVMGQGFYDEGGSYVNIVRYDSNITEYYFVQYDIANFLFLDSPNFKVNEDDTFSIVAPAPRMGMWGVKKTYRETYKGSRIYAEVQQEYYEIETDEFMKNSGMGDSLSGYEKTMWDQGYIRAYTAYKGEGINLKKNDYFKVLYDNGENYVYVVKTDGQAGWIYIGNYEQIDALNRYFFFMAG